ncbi:helix-turn-helix domain-containing protein, partial [Klebsiella pneumoniae]
KALSDEQAATLRQRATAGEPKAQLAREFNISRETLYQGSDAQWNENSR